MTNWRKKRKENLHAMVDFSIIAGYDRLQHTVQCVAELTMAIVEFEVHGVEVRSHGQ